MIQPFRMSLPLLALLAQCETWVIPCEDEEFPFSLSFFVPAHLADEFSRVASYGASPDSVSCEPTLPQRVGLHLVP